MCSEIRTLSQTKAVQPSTNRTLGYASEARARILQSLPKENVSQPLPIKKKKFWKKKFIKTAYPLQHQHHGTHIQRSQNKFSVPVHDYFHPSSLFAFLRTWKCMYAIVFVHLQISHRLFFHIAHKHNHSQKVLKPDCCSINFLLPSTRSHCCEAAMKHRPGSPAVLLLQDLMQTSFFALVKGARRGEGSCFFWQIREIAESYHHILVLLVLYT